MGDVRLTVACAVRRSRFALAALLAALCPSVAYAQPVPSGASGDAARTEARDRFDRGLDLFNGGENPAALAEFKRAYELIPNPLVLYNINDEQERNKAEEAGAAILEMCVELGGCLTGEHGVGIEKRELMGRQFDEV